MRSKILLVFWFHRLTAQNAICPVGKVDEKAKASCGNIFTMGNEKSCLAANCCWDAGLFKKNCFLLIGDPNETTTTSTKEAPKTTTIETTTTTVSVKTKSALVSETLASSADTAAAKIKNTGDSSSIGPIIGGIFGLIALLALAAFMYNKRKERQMSSAVIDLHAKTLARPSIERGKLTRHPLFEENVTAPVNTYSRDPQQSSYASYGNMQYDQYSKVGYQGISQEGTHQDSSYHQEYSPQNAYYQESPLTYVQQRYGASHSDVSFNGSAVAHSYDSRIGYRDPQQVYQHASPNPVSSVGSGPKYSEKNDLTSQGSRSLSSQVRPNSPSSSVASRGQLHGNNQPPLSPNRVNSSSSVSNVQYKAPSSQAGRLTPPISKKRLNSAADRIPSPRIESVPVDLQNINNNTSSSSYLEKNSKVQSEEEEYDWK